MLSRPKLIEAQSYFKNETPLETQEKATESKPDKTPSSPNGRFLMGLNNRVAKLDQRLNLLENTLQQVSKRQIGYRELGLTLALALLLFTSTALVVRDPSSGVFEEKLVAAITGAKTEQEEVKAAGWLQALTEHPILLSWSDNILSSQSNELRTKFRWPLEKQVHSDGLAYANHKQGIHIQAQLGDPIVAIDEGKVLYSGNGVAGYGNLILIQHPNDTISVYGNNYSNYVKKGQPIKKGELIASVGESSGNQPRLYFEIRYEGKAQDPFLYYE